MVGRRSHSALRDATDAGDEKGESRPLCDPDSAGHFPGPVTPCSATALPWPVTVRMAILARPRIWIGWMIDTLTSTPSLLPERCRSARRGEVRTRRRVRLGRVEDDRAERPDKSRGRVA